MSAESEPGDDAAPVDTTTAPVDDDTRATLKEIARAYTDLQSRVQQLEDENDRLREDLEQERKERKQAVEEQAKQRAQLLDSKLGPGYPSLNSTVHEDVQELREQIDWAQKSRASSVALINRRVSYLADEAGVEIDDDAIAHDDKLVRIIRQGCDAILDQVYPVHERARTLLLNIDEWADFVPTDAGKVAVFSAPTVKPLLEASHERSFSSSEIKRVFAKVEDLGADSPRRVVHDKKRVSEITDERRLRIWRPEQLVTAAEGMKE